MRRGPALRWCVLAVWAAACGRSGFDFHDPRLVVEVVDREDQPVAGAEIIVHEADASDLSIDGRSDADGLLVLPHPGAGAYDIIARRHMIGVCYRGRQTAQLGEPDDHVVVAVESIICL